MQPAGKGYLCQLLAYFPLGLHAPSSSFQNVLRTVALTVLSVLGVRGLLHVPLITPTPGHQLSWTTPPLHVPTPLTHSLSSPGLTRALGEDPALGTYDL